MELNRLEPKDMTEAHKLAEFLAANCHFGIPKDYRNRPGDILAVIIRGAQYGLGAIQSMDAMHIIQGKLTFTADFMKALCNKHPDCEDFSPVEGEYSDKAVTMTTTRKGRAPVTFTYTMEQAKKMGNRVNSGPWKTNPAQMLEHRATAILARLVWSEVVFGMYTPDEMEGVAEGGGEASVVGLVAEPKPEVAPEERLEKALKYLERFELNEEELEQQNNALEFCEAGDYDEGLAILREIATEAKARTKASAM